MAKGLNDDIPVAARNLIGRAIELENQAKAVRDEAHRIIASHEGLAIGCIIRVLLHGTQYKLTKIAHWSDGKVGQLFGQKIKKDGPPSERETYIGRWGRYLEVEK